jgi:hypothetical protein
MLANGALWKLDNANQKSALALTQSGRPQIQKVGQYDHLL